MPVRLEIHPSGAVLSCGQALARLVPSRCYGDGFVVEDTRGRVMGLLIRSVGGLRWKTGPKEKRGYATREAALAALFRRLKVC